MFPILEPTKILKNKVFRRKERSFSIPVILDLFHKVSTPEDLFITHNAALTRIRLSSGATSRQWDELYVPVLRSFAAYVQHLLGSVNYHHFESGGLLAHTLEVVEVAPIRA